MIQEADLVRADLCLVCDRYDAEDLLRDAAALDGVRPGAFYSSRVRKLAAFAPAAPEWCDSARRKSRGRTNDDGNDSDSALLCLDPNGDIDDPLYGNISSSSSISLAMSPNEEEESELSSALDVTVAQLRLATRGLLQFLLKLEERRHRSGGGATTRKTKTTPPPVLSLHASLRQAILCPLLSPEAERGGRGPAAAVSVVQAKAAGWRPVWQEETREREEEDEDGGGGGGTVRLYRFLFLCFLRPSSFKRRRNLTQKKKRKKNTRFPFLSLHLAKFISSTKKIRPRKPKRRKLLPPSQPRSTPSRPPRMAAKSFHASGPSSAATGSAPTTSMPRC